MKEKRELTYEELIRKEKREHDIIWRGIIPSVCSFVTAIIMTLLLHR